MVGSSHFVVTEMFKNQSVATCASEKYSFNFGQKKTVVSLKGLMLISKIIERPICSDFSF